MCGGQNQRGVVLSSEERYNDWNDQEDTWHHGCLIQGSIGVCMHMTTIRWWRVNIQTKREVAEGGWKNVVLVEGLLW